MPGYISEIRYGGNLSADFIEVAVPAGTDVSSYSLVVYRSDGTVQATYSFGSIESTADGSDVYLFDDGTPGFTNLSSNEAVALVDDLGNVIQFVSFDGNTITATEGPADGLTSTDIGTTGDGESLQTYDDGATYQVQTVPNPGIIPCYAPGTMIDTPDGPRAVETLRPGDLVSTLDHGPQPIKWVRERTEPLDSAPDDGRPVLIQAGALGPDSPAHDLIVSPQHRILVGGLGQLDGLGPGQALAPAKALTGLPRIRFMRGKFSVTWIHFACARHEVVFANGCVSESLLLGPMALSALSRYQRRALHRLFGPLASPDTALNGPPARPCLTVGTVRNLLCNKSDPVRAAA
ncbi:MAG: Hint domain-containing protein [Paracoccaceae bacterium]